MKIRDLALAVFVLFLIDFGVAFSLSDQDFSEEASAWAKKTLAGLSLEKKIGQIVCSDLTGAYVADGDPRLEQWVRLAPDYGLGMFVFYGGTPRDVAHLLNRLQKEAQIPILVAADFEGGPGQQVTGASEFPANMAFSATGSEDLVYRAASAADVEAQEFRAFKLAIDAGVDFVMSEHIAVPSVTDGSELPASVEKKLATGWLREKLGFKGILTTDDLWYDSVVQRFGTEEVAVKAFEAGHDIILKPRDPVATIAALFPCASATSTRSEAV